VVIKVLPELVVALSTGFDDVATNLDEYERRAPRHFQSRFHLVLNVEEVAGSRS
jgi:hypothetical protein